MNDITDRFLGVYEYLILEKKVKSASDFAKKIDVSTSLVTEILKKRTNAGVNPVQNIVKKFSEINAEWLLTGKGDMLKSEGVSQKGDNKTINNGNNNTNVINSPNTNIKQYTEADIILLRKENEYQKEYIEQLKKNIELLENLTSLKKQ